MFPEADKLFMHRALALAREAKEKAEVPVGAVLTLDNQIIAEAANSPIHSIDPTAHAEIIALRAGAQKLKNYRLVNTTLYVTLEPCAMCVGALVHARVKRVVFGAFDPKAGAVQSVFNLGNATPFNHKIEFEGGLMPDECGGILRDFFRERR